MLASEAELLVETVVPVPDSTLPYTVIPLLVEVIPAVVAPLTVIASLPSLPRVIVPVVVPTSTEPLAELTPPSTVIFPVVAVLIDTLSASAVLLLATPP